MVIHILIQNSIYFAWNVSYFSKKSPFITVHRAFFSLSRHFFLLEFSFFLSFSEPPFPSTSWNYPSNTGTMCLLAYQRRTKPASEMACLIMTKGTYDGPPSWRSILYMTLNRRTETAAPLHSQRPDGECSR